MSNGSSTAGPSSPSTSTELGRLVPAVVLVGTQHQGNIGSTARAMANMGLSELLLVAPKAEIGDDARCFAVGAGHVLDRAQVFDSLSDALSGFQRVVGTTSARGRHISPAPLSPRELPAFLAKDPAGTRTALVFGREATGLRSEELALCSPWIHIDCSPKQPTLNLAQAVLIVAHELNAAGEPQTPAGIDEPLASQEQLDGLFDHTSQVLRLTGFERDKGFAAVVQDLRSMMARISPSEREVRILRGICRRALWRLSQDDVRQVEEE